MTGLNVLIVDDEPLARRRIRQLLELEPDIGTIAECDDGEAAIETVVDAAPDILFLDVQMPGLDGFEVLAGLPGDRVPVTIFVTAYDQYAVRAFEVRALDYLLKPFEEDRFHAAYRRAADIVTSQRSRQSDIRRLVELIGDLKPAPAPEPAGRDPYVRRLLARSAGRFAFVRVEDIDYIEAAGNYARLHVGKASHLVRDTMARLEQRLDADQFVRIHRSTIVNIERIAELRPTGGPDLLLVLDTGTALRLSRGFRSRVEAFLRA